MSSYPDLREKTMLLLPEGLAIFDFQPLKGLKQAIESHPDTTAHDGLAALHVEPVGPIRGPAEHPLRGFPAHSCASLHDFSSLVSVVTVSIK